MRSKRKTIIYGLLAAGLSSLTASACFLQVRVACPNDTTAAGIEVCIAGVGCSTTDELGLTVPIDVGGLGTFSVCINPATLPAGAKLSPLCKNVKVESDAPPVVDFVLSGDFCKPPPPQGECWMTGGGTLGKPKTPDFSFGGVVYPGCSPKAADGGNWNVIDHASGLHFQGQHIVVDQCSGAPTSSPRVNVRIIDFHGEGIIGGIGGNPEDTVPVTFVGRVIDNAEGGAGSDQLFIEVKDAAGTVLKIGTSAAAPATISTGNLQIHTSSCGK
jgi:hypothetical protein